MAILRTLACVLLGHAAASGEVRQWDVFEIELRGPAVGNPFTDVTLSAGFSREDRTIEVDGFHDGGGIYRIRFMPDEQGGWSYRTRSNAGELDGKSGSFTVTPPGEGCHGPVRVSRTHHFAHADGTPFQPVGTTIYNWTDAPEAVQEETLRTLAASPFNKARMLLTPQPNFYQGTFPPPRWPYEGSPPRDWNLARFNPEYFRHIETRVRQLRDLGIEADLVLFHPYGRWGFERMDAAGDDRFLRHVVARFAAFRNVWWSLANEYDYLTWKSEEDWDRLGALLASCDPYQHPRSIHNAMRIYNHNRPWVTHASIQNGSAVEEPGRAQLYRDVWRKPVVYDEVKYEGDGPKRWATLDAREMTHRFWCGTVAGTYVGHGDYFPDRGDDTWTSFGGRLGGHSAPRIAFLRQVLEDGPAQGLDPIDQWQDVNTAGVPGSYYLTYFGKTPPPRWEFRLFREKVEDGQVYQSEILDTWNMTVTPVDGTFVAKRLDRYHFVDAAGRAVELPARPGIALRIRRVLSEPND